MRWFLLLALCACGGGESDLCQRLSAWDPVAHAGACEVQTYPNGFAAKCATAIQHCADWELDQLSKIADCFNGLPVCQTGGEVAYVKAETICTVMQNTVRPDCINSF